MVTIKGDAWWLVDDHSLQKIWVPAIYYELWFMLDITNKQDTEVIDLTELMFFWEQGYNQQLK